MKNQEKKEFVNPFEEGVNYDQFIKAKGNKSIEDYCNENLTENQIEILKRELTTK